MKLTRLAPLAVALVVVGCASHDDGSSEDLAPAPIAEPSPTEATAGADGVDPAVESEDVGPPVLDAPLEDSRPFLDVAAESDADRLGPAIDPAELTETLSCRRATGYRNGKAFSICVTTIDGKPVEVNTARAYVRMRAAARGKGVSLHIVSGFRTMAQQRYLYNLYLAGKGNLAAKPGYSNHQSGHALDLNTSAGGVYSFLANHGAAYRFRRTVPSEKWHWEHW
jgi:hypothetical protein